MNYITAVHMNGGEEHKHIQRVKIDESVHSTHFEWTVKEVIESLRIASTSVCVKDGSKDIPVIIVEDKPPYIRTKKDGKLSNNLLELPRY